MDEQAVIQHTRRWIESMVIGLNLCPFAQRVFQGDRIRYVVSEARAEPELLDDLARELKFLGVTAPAEIETTLLIHPHILQSFLDYNDFLTPAEELLVELDLEGEVQVAGFHPDYYFDHTEPADVENYTNRSPYPMLHLLREDSISNVVDEGIDPLQIPQRNIETLRKMGLAAVLERLEAIKKATS
jgi:hypothetical protein